MINTTASFHRRLFRKKKSFSARPKQNDNFYTTERARTMSRVTTGLDKHQLEFIKLLDQNTGAHRPYEVFRDFCEMAAIALSNAVDKPQYEEREARYLTISKGYNTEGLKRFSGMLACVVESLESRFSDCLGQLFMSLELGSHWKGQFFTPYSISLMMAKMLGEDISGDFESVMEPAVGAGGMIIARAQALKEMNINYQQRMHVTAVDVDITAVHMAYIQFSLMHIPAIVLHGNTLSNQTWGHWVTMAHVHDLWDVKLYLKGKALHAECEPESKENLGIDLPATVSVSVMQNKQLEVVTNRNIALNQMNLF